VGVKLEVVENQKLSARRSRDTIIIGSDSHMRLQQIVILDTDAGWRRAQLCALASREPVKVYARCKPCHAEEAVLWLTNHSRSFFSSGSV
jgi:hypothetical protein